MTPSEAFYSKRRDNSEWLGNLIVEEDDDKPTEKGTEDEKPKMVMTADGRMNLLPRDLVKVLEG